MGQHRSHKGRTAEAAHAEKRMKARHHRTSNIVLNLHRMDVHCNVQGAQSTSE